MATNDKYRRDSLDGGITWGTAYQFRGTDGSDASVPSYIHRTYISETEIRSPTIYGGKIYAVDGGDTYAVVTARGLSLKQGVGDLFAAYPVDLSTGLYSSESPDCGIGSAKNIVLVTGFDEDNVYIKRGGNPAKRVLTEGDSVTAVFA